MTQINKCGCSPQTGTLFLLWAVLIFCGFSVIFDVYHMTHEPQMLPQDYSWEMFKSYMVLFYKISVLITCVTGLYGVLKNKPQLLMILYYYNYFQLFFISVVIVYLFLDPIKIPKTGFSTTTQLGDHTKTTLLILFLLFGLAFQIYFTIVVKSYYEAMKDKNVRSHILILSYPEYYNYGYI